MSDLPNSLEVELNLLGVRTTGDNHTAVGNEKPKVERDYTFNLPTLD